MTPPGVGCGDRGRASLLLGPILLLALALRLHDLVSPQRGIWIDEAFSIWVARHSLPNLLEIVRTVDTHPPLFYLLLHFWVLPAHDPYWVRVFPGAVGVLTVVAGYLLGRTVGGVRCGLLSALLFAVSPVLVQYGQDVRMYALLVLFSILSLWALLVALALGGAVRWATFVAVTAALLLTYTESVFILAAEALYVLGVVRRSALRQAIVAFIVVAGVWAIWLPSALHQFSGVSHRFWIPPPDLPRVINTMLTLTANVDLPTLAAGRGAGPLSPLGAWLLFPVGLLACWGFLRLPSLARWRPAGAGRAPSAPQHDAVHHLTIDGKLASQSRWLLLAAFLVPHLGTLAASQLTPVYIDRSLLDSLAGLLPLLAAGIATLPGFSLILPATTIWCAFQFGGLATYYRFATTEDWQGPAQQVATSARPGDVVLFSGSWLQLAFDYYEAGPPLQERGLPIDLFSRGALETPMSPPDVATLPARIGNAPRVWLVYGHQGFDDPQGLVLPALRQLFRRETGTQYRGDITVYQFSEPTGGVPQVPLDDRFQGLARLSGISLQRQGAATVVSLFWQVLGRSNSNLHVFVHVLRPDGTVLAQHDGEPLGGTQHTSIWVPGTQLVDPHPITLRAGADRTLHLEIGMYDLSTGARIPTTGPQVAGGDHVDVTVANPEASPSAAP